MDGGSCGDAGDWQPRSLPRFVAKALKAVYGMLIRCHMNPGAVICDYIPMKIIGPRPKMLAARRFGGDVYSGLTGVWSAYTVILMSTR